MESKISFGFKKLPKKSAVIGAKPPEEKKVELIECLDAQNIKIIGHVEEVEAPLVIPMQGANKNLLDRIKDVNDLKMRSQIKNKTNGVKSSKEKPAEVDLRPDSELTIEELAARRLLEEARNYERKTTAVKVTTIAVEDQLLLEGAKESTMDDYESVPIGDFGLAMLRGMGWNEQLAEKKNVEAPQLRPKGMGLGASVPGNTKNKIPVDKNGKELKLIKNAKARIIAGKEKGNYCIVQGLDDDSGRVIVKTTLTGAILSLNEFMLFPVSDEEYAKSSKVLNNEKYEKYNKKSEENLKKIRDKVRDIDNGDVEYIPNGNNIKIELSSDSEVEQNKQVHQTIKQERKSRSKSPNSQRLRDKSTGRDEKYSSSKDKDKYKSKHDSRSSSHKRRERSRSRSRSRSKNRDKSNRRKYSDDSELSSDEEYKRRQKKEKSKKSKKHKKEKKSKKDKKDKKSRHRARSSSPSYSDSSESDDKSRRRR